MIPQDEARPTIPLRRDMIAAAVLQTRVGDYLESVPQDQRGASERFAKESPWTHYYYI